MNKTIESINKELGENPKMGDIKKLAKTIKQDHALANELWASGQRNLRFLASLIFDKKQLDERSVEQLANDLLTHSDDDRNQIGDWLFANQMMKNKKLTSLLETYQHHASPVLRRWYWYYEARLRWMGKVPPNNNSEALVDAFEKEVEKEEPTVQWMMNFCIAWIGVFEPELRPRCVELGERFGLYQDEVEKAPKNCTPSYLPEFIRIEVAKRDIP